MYFVDRADAGKKLAEHLLAYRDQHTVVVALSENSAVVAAQVALRLHSSMVLYMVKDINLPNEAEAAAALSSTGVFQYNSVFSAGEIEELAGEYRGYIEEQRIQKNHELNLLLGDEGAIKKEMLRHHVVIVVADGIISGFALNMIGEYLRTIAIKRFVIATPIVSAEAVDRLHTVADELHCMNVAANFLGIDHYYDKNSTTTVQDALKIIKNISLTWDRSVADVPVENHQAAPKKGRSFLS